MENLGIDPKLLLAQIVNFVIFFIIIKKFIAKPFTRFVDKQKHEELEKERITNDLKKSEEDLQTQEIQAKGRIIKRESEAIQEAKKQGGIVKNQIIQDAKDDGQDIRKKAKEQIEHERKTLEVNIKKKTVDLSVLLLEKVLKKSLDINQKRKITKDILSKSREKIFTKS